MPSHVASFVVRALSGLALVATVAASSYAPKVNLSNGTYKGVHNKEFDQDFFLGIPYAQPPVGSLRFKAPEALNEEFDETRSATEYGWMCIGYGSDTSNLGNPVNEDCLTLNVVRPRGVRPGDELPVGLWVHGGSYTQGGSRDPRYNLSEIVDQSVKENKPIVAVSINYRLSLWGFLFSKEMQEAGAGNIAFKDQRLALQWLHDNIAAFGGSPDKVTIWGESAGARSLGMQLIAYDGQSQGLFNGAILQSGSPIAKFNNAAGWQPYFDALVQKTGCSDAADRLACLRELPWQTLSDIFSGKTPLSVAAPTLSAVIDGDFMTAQGTDLLKQGKFMHVPLLTGNNFDEGTAYAKTGINTDTEFTSWLASQGLNNAQISAISTLYPDDPAVGIPVFYEGRPGGSFGSQFKRVAAFAGDYQQHAGRRALAETWAAAGLPVYTYMWNVHVNGLPNPIYGATHFQEVAFVFNNVAGRGYSPSPFAGKPQTFVELADLMSKQWVAFMSDSDPNVEDVAWPQYTSSNRDNLVFDVNVDDLHYIAEDNDRTEAMAYLLEKVFI
jgi:acetylcholinesterase